MEHNQINSESAAHYGAELDTLLTLAKLEINQDNKLRLYVLAIYTVLNQGGTLPEIAHQAYLNIEAKPELSHTKALLEMVIVRDAIHEGLTRLIELYEQGVAEEARLDAERGK